MFEDIMKEFFLKYKGFEEEAWDKFWQEYKESPIVEDVLSILNLYRQRVWSTCDFYLKYKDKPDLFSNEQFSVDWKYHIKTGRYVLMTGENKWIDYNDWLFKFAFKDVLGKEIEA